MSRRESLGRNDVAQKGGRELPQVVIRLPGENVAAPRQLSLANSVKFSELFCSVKHARSVVQFYVYAY
jgi:hypothetical protein